MMRRFDCELICTECVGEWTKGLSSFVQDKGAEGRCYLCSTEGITIEYSELYRYISDCIDAEFGTPNDEGMSIDPDTRDWAGEVFELEDMLDQAFFEVDNEALHEKVLEDLGRHSWLWCKKDINSLQLNQALHSAWGKFCRFVKHRARYTFFITPDPNYDEFQHDEIYSPSILPRLKALVTRCELLETISEETCLYRIRIVAPDKFLSKAAELGPPPQNLCTQPSRMSPPGVVMMYCAFDGKTAEVETYEPSEIPKKIVLGAFKVIKPLRVLNLCNMPDTPGIFESNSSDHHQYKEEIKFFHSFLDDFSKPIQRDGSESIEYIPTQVVTEYLRFHCSNTEIDGIIYPSSKPGGKISVVLFLTSAQLTDDSNPNPPDSNCKLVLTSICDTNKPLGAS